MAFFASGTCQLPPESLQRFNAPIAAITFTLEELLGDLDQTMLSGVIVPAPTCAVVEHSILGTNPVFHMPRAYTLPMMQEDLGDQR